MSAALETLCLCRDQPAECVCMRREATARRERQMQAMAFGMNRAPRVVPAAPVPYPLGYGERDAQV